MVGHFLQKFLSRREAQCRLELERSRVEKGWGDGRRTAGRDLEGTRPRARDLALEEPQLPGWWE